MTFAPADGPGGCADETNRHCLASKIVVHEGCVAALRREVPHRMRYEPADHHLLVLHRTGPVAIELKVDDATLRHVVPGGSIHVVPPDCPFDFALLEPLSTLHLILPTSWISSGPAGTSEPPPAATIRDDPVLHHLLEALARYIDQGGDRFHSFEHHILHAVSEHLARLPAAAGAQDEKEASEHRHRERVHAAIAYMERNLSESFSVADVAVAVGISASRFARVFTMVTGMSPQRYVSELRLMRARALLATDLSIVGVALSCGFSNQEHFTNRFREKFGEPPGRWRQRRLDRGLVASS